MFAVHQKESTWASQPKFNTNLTLLSFDKLRMGYYNFMVIKELF